MTCPCLPFKIVYISLKLRNFFDKNQQHMLSRDYIENLTDHLQQAVLAVDQSGVIVYCNDSASHYWQREWNYCLEGIIKICFKQTC